MKMASSLTSIMTVFPRDQNDSTMSAGLSCQFGSIDTGSRPGAMFADLEVRNVTSLIAL